jgi:hypothetical protein
MVHTKLYVKLIMIHTELMLTHTKLHLKIIIIYNELIMIHKKLIIIYTNFILK